MPTFKTSAMDPSGTWQPDAMDQVEQWNANRGDQWSRYAMSLANQNREDDWRKQVALQQLVLQRDMWQGGREDTAAARQLEADRWGKQFDYMSGRDKLMDERTSARDLAEQERWNKQFDLQKSGIDEARKYRTEEREATKPLRDLQVQIAKMELAERMRRQQAMEGAAGAAVYVPQTDTGKEAYQAALAMTGNPLQAGMSAKTAERQRASEQASMAKGRLEAMLQDFSAKDRAVVGWDPTPQDRAAIVKQAEALKQLILQSGASASEADDAVAQIMRSNLTSGGRTDWNAGPSEELITQFGGTYR